MDSENLRSVKYTNTAADINSGLGIFRGKPEITGKMGCLIISVVCVISTIVFAFGSFGAESMVKDDIILLVIFILITALVVFFTVFSFTYPYRKRGKLIFEGIWFSKDKIWLGEQEILLKEKCSINNLMKNDCTNCIPANWIQTKRVSSIDIKEISMGVQLVNSKHDGKDYRIEKIYIFKEKDDLHYDFDLRPTVLLSNGILSSCNTVPLIDQLRKLTKGTLPIQKNGGNCYLYITSHGDSHRDLSQGIKRAGKLNTMAKNKTEIQHTIFALETGEFMDKETSAFLTTFIKDHGWKIELSPLHPPWTN